MEKKYRFKEFTGSYAIINFLNNYNIQKEDIIYLNRDESIYTLIYYGEE